MSQEGTNRVSEEGATQHEHHSDSSRPLSGRLDFLPLGEVLAARRISATPAPALVTEGLADQHASIVMPEHSNHQQLISEPLHVVATEPTPRPKEEDSALGDYFSSSPGRRAEAASSAKSRQNSHSPALSRQTSRSVAGVDNPSRHVSPSATEADLMHMVNDRLDRATNVIAEASERGHAKATDQSPERVRPRRSFTDYPQYPNQSLAALQHQKYPEPHKAPYNSRPIPPRLQPLEHFRSARQTSGNSVGSRTAGNTPIQTPNFTSARHRQIPSNTSDDDESPFPSPYLHPVQTRMPKETRHVTKEVDMYSGRKIINQYEIDSEIGRGTHGKVKLARNLVNGDYVAIKIVTRYAKKKRLGKEGQRPEDQAKKEIAILKKATHPNVVSMLEVIDDPEINKIYLVLEFCEAHDVKWRQPGTDEIVLLEYKRLSREKNGAADGLESFENDKLMKGAMRRRERMLNRRRPTTLSRINSESDFWSLEYAGESDDEESENPSQSSPAATSEPHVRPVSEPVTRSNTTGSEDVAPDEVAQPHVQPPDAGARDVPERPNTVDKVELPPSAPLKDLPNSIDSQVAQSIEGFDFNAELQRRLVTEDAIHQSEMNARGRQTSVAESTTTVSSSITNYVEDHVPEEFRYVPMMTIPETRMAFRDALLGLEYLHYHGIVHRDIKPENLLRKADHHVKISDFGVSYLGKPIRDGRESEEASENEAPEHEEETELAKTVGTPAFFAPELCSLDLATDSKAVTYQIDVWALGVTLYCLLFARTPFLAVNEFAMMRAIVEEDVFIPRKRLKAVDNKSSRSNSRAPLFPDRREHRLPQELLYDDIDEELMDLLKRLLIKDPKRRIHLKEIKHHPWVLRDLKQKEKWLNDTDPVTWAEGKKIEISNNDVKDAVIPLKLFDRLKAGVKKVTGTLGFGRKRGESSAGSSEAGSHNSSATNIQAPARSDPIRGSVRSDEIVAALQNSREQGLDRPRAQDTPADSEVDSENINQEDGSLGPLWSPPRSRGNGEIHSPRPLMPARKESAMSTTASIRTLKQSDFTGSAPRSASPSPPEQTQTALPSDPAGTTSLGAIFTGAGRSFMRSMRSRERRGSGTRSPAQDMLRSGNTSTESLQCEPSTAVSNMSAIGRLNLPSPFSVATRSSSPSSSRNTSSLALNLYHQQPRPSEREQWSSRTSSPAVGARGRPIRQVDAAHRIPSDEWRDHHTSSGDDLQRAMHSHVAQRLLDDARQQDQHLQSRPASSASSRPCPPSPDDEIHWQRQEQLADSREMSPAYLELSPHDAQTPHDTEPHDRPISTSSVASSSNDKFNSEMSRPTSLPSGVSVVSADSSVQPDPGSQHQSKDRLEVPMSQPPQTDTSNGLLVLTSPSDSQLNESRLPASAPPDVAEPDKHFLDLGQHLGQDQAVTEGEDEDEGDSSSSEELMLAHRTRSRQPPPPASAPPDKTGHHPRKPRGSNASASSSRPARLQLRDRRERASSIASVRSNRSTHSTGGGSTNAHKKLRNKGVEDNPGDGGEADDEAPVESRPGGWSPSLRGRGLASLRLQE